MQSVFQVVYALVCTALLIARQSIDFRSDIEPLRCVSLNDVAGLFPDHCDCL